MAYNGRVDIWIKQEDRAKWDAIEDKPQWLHDRLNRKWDKGDTSARDALVAKSSVFDEPVVEPMEETA